MSVLLGAIALAACAARAPHADPAAQTQDGCRARVIVAFAINVEIPANVSVVTDIARATHVSLSYVRSLTAQLHVFNLTAADADSSCGQALGRLRADPRVRSVDIDVRRKHF